MDARCMRVASSVAMMQLIMSGRMIVYDPVSSKMIRIAVMGACVPAATTAPIPTSA
jgi:hypothetical protein